MREGSFLQSTLRSLNHLKTGRPLLIAANEYRFVVGEQLEATGIQADVMIEPANRNSGAAIAAAAEVVAATDPKAVLMVVPTDFGIETDGAFDKALRVAVEAANSEALVAFGTTPLQDPELQASYIELESEVEETSKPQKIQRV